MTTHDPHKTQRLAPLTTRLARPVTLPAAGVMALSLAPLLLLLTALALWPQPQPHPVPRPQPPLLLAPTAAPAAAVSRPANTLARAVLAYAAPEGAVLGALQPGRVYTPTARSGLGWVQLDVTQAGEQANLVWVRAAEVGATLAALPDLTPPTPAPTPQTVYVFVAAPPPPPAPAAAAAPAPEVPAAEPAPAPAPTYLVPPATAAPRSVVMQPIPTGAPCRLAEVGSTLRVCNGITP